MRDAHADFFLAFARAVDADIKGTTQLDAMHRAGATTRTACRAPVATARARGGDSAALEKGMRLSGRLYWFWHIVGQHLTARVAVDELLALAADRPPSHGRGRARLTSGMIATATGEWERGRRDARGAFDDGRATATADIAAEAMMFLGYVHLHGGRMDEARAALDDAIERSVGGVGEFNVSLAMSIKGMVLFASGDVDAGMALIEEARVIQQRKGDYEGSLASRRASSRK